MSTKAFTILSIIFVGGLIGFAMYYNHSGENTGASVARPSGHTQTRSAARSQQANDFSLSQLGGGTITLSQYQGEKAVILDFFATWCPNCRRDMPKLSKWYEKYKDQVEVIGINLRENEEKIKDFIDSRSISFPIALDPHGRTSQAYGIRYTNTHILISKEGNVVREIPGDIKESDIVSLIQSVQ